MAVVVLVVVVVVVAVAATNITQDVVRNVASLTTRRDIIQVRPLFAPISDCCMLFRLNLACRCCMLVSYLLFSAICYPLPRDTIFAKKKLKKRFCCVFIHVFPLYRESAVFNQIRKLKLKKPILK